MFSEESQPLLQSPSQGSRATLRQVLCYCPISHFGTSFEGLVLFWCCLLRPEYGSLHRLGLPGSTPALAPDAPLPKSRRLAGRSPTPRWTPCSSSCSSSSPPSRPTGHSHLLVPADAGRLGLPHRALLASPLHRQAAHGTCLFLDCHRCPCLHWGGGVSKSKGCPWGSFSGALILSVRV